MCQLKLTTNKFPSLQMTLLTLTQNCTFEFFPKINNSGSVSKLIGQQQAPLRKMLNPAVTIV
jgi:hypothetical protein